MSFTVDEVLDMLLDVDPYEDRDAVLIERLLASGGLTPRIRTYLQSQERWDLLETYFKPDAAWYINQFPTTVAAYAQPANALNRRRPVVHGGHGSMPDSFFWREDIPVDIRAQFTAHCLLPYDVAVAKGIPHRTHPSQAHLYDPKPWDPMSVERMEQTIYETEDEDVRAYLLTRLVQCLDLDLPGFLKAKSPDDIDELHPSSWDILRRLSDKYPEVLYRFRARVANNIRRSDEIASAPTWFRMWIFQSPIHDELWEMTQHTIDVCDILGDDG